MPIVGLLVALVIFCLAWWAVSAILAAFGVGDPIATLVKVIFVILAVLYLLSAIGVVNVGPQLRLR